MEDSITENSCAFIKHFSDLTDPRIERHKRYSLMEILLVILTGTICGADSWRDYVIFGQEKLDYLRRFFPYENGIPCKNTFARVMQALDHACFKECFSRWIKAIQDHLEGVIAIDGKALRHSFNKANDQSAIYMVSAFASATGLVLAQEKVDEKSNEITAVPKLLEVLAIKGAIVTIDAMGCQKSIAKQIREQEGDYVLALKGNQGTLHKDIELFLEAESNKSDESSAITDFSETVDKGHGRIEVRKCYVTDQLDWLEQKAKWQDLQSAVMIESTREINGETSIERRYYISSLPANAELISGAIRSHWGIENQVHWVLDVTFGEDGSRVRTGNAAENMSIVRHIALNMLRSAKKKMKNISIKGLRKKAGWGNKTLDNVMQQLF